MENAPKRFGFLRHLLCVLLTGVLALALFYVLIRLQARILPKCTIQWGIPCAGCYGTRAIKALLHGEVIRSISLNVFPFLLVLLFLWWLFFPNRLYRAIHWSTRHLVVFILGILLLVGLQWGLNVLRYQRECQMESLEQPSDTAGFTP